MAKFSSFQEVLVSRGVHVEWAPEGTPDQMAIALIFTSKVGSVYEWRTSFDQRHVLRFVKMTAKTMLWELDGAPLKLAVSSVLSRAQCRDYRCIIDAIAGQLIVDSVNDGYPFYEPSTMWPVVCKYKKA